MARFVRPLVICGILLLAGSAPADAYALKAYFEKPEPHVQLIPQSVRSYAGQRVLVFRFDSVSWRGNDQANPQQWWHWMVVHVPPKIFTDDIFFYLSNGSNNDKIPTHGHAIATEVASKAGMVAVELKMLPNQPIEILRDGKKRIEDDFLARSWFLAMARKDPEWAGHLPMAKAASLGMDSIRSQLRKMGLNQGKGKFVVAGVSKRGWATWLLAAVRPDIKAFLPIVIDIVNVIPSMRHHKSILGKWSWVLADYEREQVTGNLEEPSFEWLMQTIDPYRRLNDLTQKKFIINAANDQFFLPDSHTYYSSALKGETLWRFVPNKGHNLDRSDYVRTISAYCQYLAKGVALPQISWVGDKIAVSPQPAEALYWSAASKDGDFRLAKGYPKFKAIPLLMGPDGHYEVPSSARYNRSSLHSVGFGEFTFKNAGMLDLKLTTTTKVWRPGQDSPSRRLK